MQKLNQMHALGNTGVMEAETISKNAANLKSQTSRGIVFFVMIAILFASCSTAKIYTRPDATAYTMNHKKLAILPSQVKIMQNKGSVENKLEQEKVDAINAQNEMYSRMLTFIQKGKMPLFFDIQEIDKTNAILQKIGYSNEDGADMPPEALAQQLGVDALLYSDYVFLSYKQVVAGILFAIIFFPYGTYYGIMMAVQPCILGDATIRLYDGATGLLLYSYNNKYSGRYINLVDLATKMAGRKSPYYIK